MNKIRFEVNHGEYGKAITPIIDEKSLISILKEIKLPFAKKEGSPTIAGQYGGLFISKSVSLFDYFLGKTNTKENNYKTLVLLCDCSFEGCWDFLVKIIVHKTTIKWSDFEQIQRENWDYSKLGVFSFNRKQYENSLKDLEFEIGI